MPPCHTCRLLMVTCYPPVVLWVPQRCNCLRTGGGGDLPVPSCSFLVSVSCTLLFTPYLFPTSQTRRIKEQEQGSGTGTGTDRIVRLALLTVFYVCLIISPHLHPTLPLCTHLFCLAFLPSFSHYLPVCPCHTSSLLSLLYASTP